MNVVELFSCSGGMAEGFRRAGLPVSMAFDWDDDACDSYAANHGHRPIRMNARDLLRLVADGKWTPLERVDLFVADPPCTPWSRAGKRRGVEDERDMLAVTVDLIRRLRPRAYLIANVPGLDDGPNWPVVQKLIGGLARDGYCVADFTRLDAADFGVPQHRVRPFWFGHLAGPCVVWPARTHGAPEEARALTIPGVDKLKSWVTCREALSHLDPKDLGAPIRLRCRTNLHPPSEIDKPSNVIPSSMPGNGGAVLLAGPNHRPSVASEPARTLTRNTHSDGALLVHPRHPVSDADDCARTITGGDGGGAKGARVLAWPWDRPSTTVCGGIDKITPANEKGGQFGPNAIKLSERAAAILQGFPEGWVFAGKTKASRWSQIGMAMPPALAEAVARSIRRALDRAAKGAA